VSHVNCGTHLRKAGEGEKSERKKEMGRRREREKDSDE
jgi:hypothetical protein